MKATRAPHAWALPSRYGESRVSTFRRSIARSRVSSDELSCSSIAASLGRRSVGSMIAETQDRREVERLTLGL